MKDQKAPDKKKNKNKIIWLSVLILLICVSVTTLAFTDIMNLFLPDDEGAISLIPETDGKSDQKGKDQNKGGKDQDKKPSQTTTTVTEPAPVPGFEVDDGKKAWTTNTNLELFRISYEGGEPVITTLSDKGDKIIAPGTKNSYVFKLKNTGEVAMDYTVEIDAYFSPADVTIPITARLCRFDGRWIAGDKENYGDVATLDRVRDNYTLGAGKFSYYTLEWEWPFEGDDELDTLLGNMAVEEDLIFTIRIRTFAAECDDPNADGGLTPQTGDDSHITLWIIMSISTFALLLFLLFRRDKEDQKTPVITEAKLS